MLCTEQRSNSLLTHNVMVICSHLARTIDTHGQDKYGRTLGDVFLLDGTHVPPHAKTDGAGGIGSMHREIPCWKGWRRKPEKRRGACGSIRSRSRHGSGGSRSDRFIMIPRILMLVAMMKGG